MSEDSLLLERIAKLESELERNRQRASVARRASAAVRRNGEAIAGITTGGFVLAWLVWFAGFLFGFWATPTAEFYAQPDSFRTEIMQRVDWGLDKRVGDCHHTKSIVSCIEEQQARWREYEVYKQAVDAGNFDD